MPNYPSKKWIVDKHNEESPAVLRTVYIGTLSLEYSYIEEYCKWVIGQDGNVTFDLYSYNLNEKTKDYIENLKSPFIRLIIGGVEYSEIPTILESYHVGLVLYKALTINYKYNAPNKIFEYLAFDLDVWCSDKLITAKNHERTDFYPKMLMVNFENLKEFDIEETINREGLKFVPSPYVCEPVYGKLIEELSA
jgi:hypothetical protein